MIACVAERWAFRAARHIGEASQRGQGAGDQGGHARGEGQPQIDLGQAQVAPVGAHDPAVVGQGEHGAGGEGMPADGGDGRHRQPEQAGEQGLHGAHEGGGVGAPLGHVVEVEPVGPDLAVRRGDQGGRGGRRRHLVQRLVHLAHGGRVEAVVALAQAEDPHVAVSVQAGHGVSGRSGADGPGVSGRGPGGGGACSLVGPRGCARPSRRPGGRRRPPRRGRRARPRAGPGAGRPPPPRR